MAAETFAIIADKLLSGLNAVLPLVSKDKERPHLTQVRFIVGREKLELQATDGRALGKVFAPLEEGMPRGKLEFCLQRTFAPSLLKALGRLSSEGRKTTMVRWSVGKHRITVQVGDVSVVLPNLAEQLSFPDVDKVVPVPSSDNTTSVTTFGVGPSLFARVMRAAACISASIVWHSPASPTSGIRFDVVDGEGSLSATYVVMPVDLAQHEHGDDGDEGATNDAQTSFLPDEKPKDATGGVSMTFEVDGKQVGPTVTASSADELRKKFEKATRSKKPTKPKK